MIRSIVHVEPPAHRDAKVLALQADFQWAEDVEHLMQIQDEGATDERVQPAQRSNNISLISFRSGKGELFRKMLFEEKECKPLCKSLQDAGYPLVLQASKTKVLVRPDQYLQIVNSPTLNSRTLKRIAESEENLMHKVLVRLASKQWPRENKAERVGFDLGSFASKFVKERTFIVEVPMLFVANAIVQSTTEAVRSSSSASLNSLSSANAKSTCFTHAINRNPCRCVLGAWCERGEDDRFKQKLQGECVNLYSGPRRVLGVPVSAFGVMCTVHRRINSFLQ